MPTRYGSMVDQAIIDAWYERRSYRGALAAQRFFETDPFFKRLPLSLRFPFDRALTLDTHRLASLYSECRQVVNDFKRGDY